MLDSLERATKDDKLEVGDEIENLRKLLTPNVEAEMERYKKTICDFLEFLIIRGYYTETQAYEAKTKQDVVLSKALQLIHNGEKCEEILGKE